MSKTAENSFYGLEDLPNSPYTILCTAVLLLVVTLYWLGTYQFSALKSLGIRGPSPLPFLGNLLLIRRYGKVDFALLNCMKMYGKVFSFCVGRDPAIIIADPDMIKEVTVKEFANFRNRAVFKAAPPLDTQLGGAVDDTWKRIRTILTPSFTGGKLKQMVPLMEESFAVLEEKLDRALETDNSVDIRPFMEQVSLEILLSCAFGVTSNVQRNPENEYVRRVKRIFSSRSNAMLYFPALPFQWLVRKITGSVFTNFCEYFLQIAQGIIGQRRAHGVSASDRKDLVYLMLQAQQAGAKLTDDEIAAQSVTFLLNGYHTTSSFLVSILYYAALYPKVQQKMYEEIADALRENEDKPVYDMVMGMEYMACVIDEVMRVTIASGTQINRRCTESCTINGVHFPKGILVVLSLYLLHNDPDAWQDPDKFDPERFGAEAKAERNPYQFITFGSGPRICIGMRFAQVEIRLLLLRLLKKYEFCKIAQTEEPGTAGAPPNLVQLGIKKRAA